MNQAAHGGFRRLAAREQVKQFGVGHHAAQAVGAQQHAVPGAHGQAEQFQPGAFLAAQGVADHAAPLVGARFFLGEQAQAHLLGDPGVIVGQAVQFPAAQQVGAGVPHVRNEQRIPVHERGQERGAHPDVFPDRVPQHGQVGGLDRLDQPDRRKAAPHEVMLAQRIERQIRGEFPGGVPTHAVGNRKQPPTRQIQGHDGVLVDAPGALPTHVRQQPEGQGRRCLAAHEATIRHTPAPDM